MSAGYSSSSGTEDSNQQTAGTRSGQSKQTNDSATSFDSSTTTQTAVPKWAKRGNKALFDSRSAASGEAVDFLTGLLSNPLDNSAPKNRYAEALDNLFSTQLTRARSGDAQQLGNARQGFREAAAITDAQTAAIGTGASAANSLLTNANPNANLDFSRLIAPVTQNATGTSNTVGTSLTDSNETTAGTQSGTTNMSGSNTGAGITLCCFIFLQAYHGQLPWFVRKCRDQFCSGRRVLGYNRMAKQLVPRMAESKLVASMVWHAMIRPLTRFGGWLYDEPGYKFGWVYAPVTALWFGVWSMLGKNK